MVMNIFFFSCISDCILYGEVQLSEVYYACASSVGPVCVGNLLRFVYSMLETLVRMCD